MDDVEERRQAVDVVELARQRAREVEAEAVDVALDHPVAERVHDQPQDARVDHVEAVARAREVHVEALVLGAEPVVALVVDALEAEHRAEVVALRGVVVDHVEDHLDAGAVQRLDHALELAHLLALVAGRGVGGVRREEADRRVAPVVGQPLGVQEVLVGDVVDGQELDRRDAQVLEVGDRVLAGEAGVGAAQVLADALAPHREALDVRLVDDGLVPRRAQRPVALPLEARVDDHALGDRVGGVLVVDLEIGVLRARRDVGEHVAEVEADRPLDRLGVRVEDELGGIEAVALGRRVGAVHAEAVALAGADERQVRVPVERGPLAQLDALLGVVLVEQAQLDARGVLGEDREVRAAAVPVRPERERVAGPDLAGAHRTTAPASRCSAPSRTSPAVRTGSPSSGQGSVAEVGEDAIGAAAHGQPAAVRARLGLGALGAQPRAQRERLAVERAQPGGLPAAGQLGSLEGHRVLGIGDFLTEGRERRELAAPALPGRLGDLRVDVVGEEAKGRDLAVFLPLEEHGGERCQTRQQRGERARLGGRAVAVGAVADLVVIGGEDDEALGRDVGRRRAEAVPAEGGERAVVDVRAVEGLGERAEVAELLVPAVGLAGEGDAEGVVEVVGPGGVAPPAAAVRVAHHLRVVHPRLGDHERAGVGRVDAARQGGDEVLGAGVHQRVDRVEAQAVEVEVADPALRGLQDPLAHGVRAGVVEVHRLAPRRRVLVGEVGAEGLHGLHAGGAEVVVDDVEDDGEPLGVGGVDEAGEVVGRAVGGVRGVEVDAVVAPAVAAGELGQRHQLDRGHAELAQRLRGAGSPP